MAKTRPDNPMISVVVPVLDEVDCVDDLVRRVQDALAGENVRLEILFVNDGSSDGTGERLRELHSTSASVKAIHFRSKRNVPI